MTYNGIVLPVRCSPSHLILLTSFLLCPLLPPSSSHLCFPSFPPSLLLSLIFPPLPSSSLPAQTTVDATVQVEATTEGDTGSMIVVALKIWGGEQHTIMTEERLTMEGLSLCV